MRILITGGAGFIGSHLADACLAQGHEVAVADDLSTGSFSQVPAGARFYKVDVCGPQIDEVFALERPEIVSHHAAQVSVRRSMEEPIHDANVNVLGSLHLLEAARRHGTRRVVFASTGGAIYGEVESGAADEHHRCRPDSPYAVAKLAVEHYLAGYHSARGLETVVLRYANVYGPRQDPHGEAGVIAIFIQRILAGLGPTIYGDGEQVRDFVYVADVVRANLLAHAAAAAADPLILNVATGRGTTVNALWSALVEIAQPSVSVHYEPARAGDLLRSVLDPARAARIFGWRPEVELEHGLRQTWAWFTADRARERAVA